MERNVENKNKKTKAVYVQPCVEIFQVELEGVISSSKPITPDIGDNGSPDTRAYRTSFPQHGFGED